MSGFEDFMNNPMAMMGLGILGGNYGRNSRAAFSNSIQGGLGAYAMAQRQAALKKKQEREDAKFKLEQNQYDRLKAAADIYRSKNPSLAGLPDEAVVEIMQKEHTPTALKKNMGLYANNPELIQKAASNFGMTPAQLMRINSGVPDPTSPGKPGEPIKAENQDEWVNPQTMQTLGDYNRANPKDYIGDAQSAYGQGFKPVSTEERKRMLGAKTSSSQAGSYYDDVMKFYDMTEGQDLWDKGAVQFGALVGKDEEKANQLRLIKSKHESLGVSLARAMGEVGTMTDKDIIRWVKRLPKPFADFDGFADNKESAKMKMKSLEDDLTALGINVNWKASDPSQIFSPQETWSDAEYEYRKVPDGSGGFKTQRRRKE